MQEHRYRVLFWGELDASADLSAQQVRDAFARRFAIKQTALLDKVFSGRKVAIRSGLSEQDAFALQGVLLGIGMCTRIEKEKASADVAEQGPSPSRSGQASPEQVPGSHLSAEWPARKDAERLAEEGLHAAPVSPRPSPAAARPSPGKRARVITAPASRIPPEQKAPCRQCQQPVSVRALHCRYCGARQLTGTHKGLAVVLLLGCVLLVGLVMLAVQAGVPAYQHYQVRQQVAAGVAEGMRVKTHVEAFYQRTGFIPSANLDAGLPEPELYRNDVLARIAIGQGGVITLTWRSALPVIGGKTLVFAPVREGQGVVWQCVAGTLDQALIPAGCTQVAGRGETREPRTGDTGERPSGQGEALASGNRDNFLRRIVRDELRHAEPMMRASAAYYQQHRRWPVANWEMNLAPPAQWGSHAVSSIGALPEGEVLLRFSSAVPELSGRELKLVARVRGGQVTWFCEARFPAGWVPQACAEGMR